MTTTRSALTEADVSALVRGATDDDRAAAAHRLCRRIDQTLSDADRRAAEEVLRILAQDAAELVRRALAVTLRASPHLPRDVALRLAEDVEAVAAPVLSASPVFTDEDLVAVVRGASALKQMAVARRDRLSEAVTGALVECANEDAVRTALSNDAADFSEDGLLRAVERFAAAEGVTTAMAYRRALPLSITEKLVEHVSGRVRQHLIDRHQVSPETAVAVALGTRERATLDLVDQAGRAADMPAFVAHLKRQDRLTPSLLLRALAHGHMGFLEWGLAELSGVPHHRTWLMVHDAGPLGLRAIYERAGLPARLFQAFRAGVDTYHAVQAEGARLSAAAFQDRMIQRFLTRRPTASAADLDYLLEKMDRPRVPADPPAERMRVVA